MTASKKPVITIIGAGLAGTFLAINLAKRGHKVEIYERNSEEETIDMSSKRSFVITFYGYGVEALKEAGLWEKVEPILLPLKGSATQITPKSDYTISHFAFNEMTYYSVSRSEMLATLIDAAKRESNITFKFQQAPIMIDRHKRNMTVYNSKTNKTKIVKCDVIIGADGVNSLVRSFIQQGQPTDHNQMYEDWTYRQIIFSPETCEKLGMEPKMTYAWTRKHAAIVGFPQASGQFGALLMLPHTQELGFNTIKTAEDVKKIVEEQFPVLQPALDIVIENLLNNPDGHFVTIRTNPWHYRDFMAIVGDAAHGFTPFYGMGTATAFGDCMELVHLMDKHGADWAKIFPLYQEARKKNTDIIGSLSQQAMKWFTRCRKADYGAVYDKIGNVLHKTFPQWYLPSMFYLVSREPNRSAEFLQMHKKQDALSKFFGISLAAAGITAMVAAYERLSKTK